MNHSNNEHSEKETGLITVLLERLEEQRLPRMFALKEKVDRGERLDGREIDYLQGAIGDARRVLPMIDRHPEYQPLTTKVLELYGEISARALENEKSG